MQATNKIQHIPFIYLFKSALHVSGDKLAHPQEYFLTVYTETCRADLKRSINGICCNLLVVFIVVLMMHGLTNIKFLLRVLCEVEREDLWNIGVW